MNLHATRLTWIGLAMLVLSVIGFGLSAAYHLVTCVTPEGCRLAGSATGLGVALWPGGTAVEPPWFITLVFAGGLLLSSVVRGIGLVGTIVVFLYGALWIAGEGSEGLTRWAYTNNFGIGLFLFMQTVAAGGTVLAAGWELVDRIRNGLRLPAGAH